MITRVICRTFTNSPYILTFAIFRKIIYWVNSLKPEKSSLLSFLWFFPQKWQFRLEIEIFEISQNLVYLQSNSSQKYIKLLFSGFSNWAKNNRKKQTFISSSLSAFSLLLPYVSSKWPEVFRISTGRRSEVIIFLDCRCEQTSKSWSPSKRSFLIQWSPSHHKGKVQRI